MIDVKSIQRALQGAGLYAGQIDGDFGPKTAAAAGEKLRSLGITFSFWNPQRSRIAIEQWVLKEAGFYTGPLDGLYGPQTQVSVEKWQDHITFVRPTPAPEAGVLRAQNWPRQKDMVAFYGEPGKTTKMTSLVSPYPLYLDWDVASKISKFTIHEKCAESALRVMNAILGFYGLDRIHELGIDQFGGCLNVRKMRGGSSWSTHAFGAAIDWDADRNTLRENHRTARFAKPEYKAFLDAWEAEGWISLGRARDFDWMHMQAARL